MERPTSQQFSDLATELGIDQTALEAAYDEGCTGDDSALDPLDRRDREDLLPNTDVVFAQKIWLGGVQEAWVLGPEIGRDTIAIMLQGLHGVARSSAREGQFDLQQSPSP